jgi:hypothetical protein
VSEPRRARHDRVVGRRVLLAAIIVVLLPYAWSPVYRFPDATPFNGSSLYNPYAGGGGAWKRANLHAHGNAWAGLTSGEQPSADVVRTYRSLGYDIAGISNYQAIAAHDGIDILPLYEHGYNISKRHQLAIGARTVDWMDYIFWQSPSQEQHILDRQRARAELVGLTHPRTRNAYSASDLAKLTGYHFIEIVNGPFDAAQPWDAALSSGRAVWAMANDDTHDTTDPRRTGMAWMMIDTPTTSHPDVIAALRAGRSYAVGRNDDAPSGMDTWLTDVQVVDGTVQVSTGGAPATIEFIGDRGAPRQVTTRAHLASYVLHRDDSYVRAVIESPQVTLYLNPIVRWNGRELGAPIAPVDTAMTWGLRLTVGLALVLAAGLLWRRRTVSSPAPALALTPTGREIA